MRFLSFLTVAFLLSVACSGGQGDTASEHSVDIGATVDAAVEAAIAAERESWTPVPTATMVPTPTPTPVPTATLIPTPEPHVALPGSVEVGIERMSQCFHENESWREVVVEMLVASGDATREEAYAYAVLLGNEEFLKLALVAAAEEDPEYAQMMSVWGGLSEEMCPSELEFSDAVDLEVSGDDLLLDGEVYGLAGELFDCLQENEEFADRFWADAGGAESLTLAESIRSDRQSFIEFLGAIAVLSDFDLSRLGSSLEKYCR